MVKNSLFRKTLQFLRILERVVTIMCLISLPHHQHCYTKFSGKGGISETRSQKSSAYWTLQRSEVVNYLRIWCQSRGNQHKINSHLFLCQQLYWSRSRLWICRVGGTGWILSQAWRKAFPNQHISVREYFAIKDIKGKVCFKLTSIKSSSTGTTPMAYYSRLEMGIATPLP